MYRSVFDNEKKDINSAFESMINNSL